MIGRRSPRSWIARAAVWLVLAACTQPGSGAGNQPKGDIRIWFATGLSGAFAELGQTACNGAQLAADQVAQQGGLARGPHKGAKLVVQCVDDGQSPEATTTLAAHWIQDPSVWTMMGFSGSPQAQAAARVGQPAGTVVIASNVGGAGLTASPGSGVFVTAPLPAALAWAWVDFCSSYYGATKIADLSPDTADTIDYRKGRDAAIKAVAGVTIVVEQTYGAGTQDLSVALGKIKNSGAQCLLLGSYPPELCTIGLAARTLVPKIPIVGLTASGMTSGRVAAGGGAYVGIAFGDALSLPPVAGSTLDTVAKAFLAKYSAPISGYAAEAYDGVLALKCAVEDGANSREDLPKYLPNVDCDGLQTRLKFANSRLGDRVLTVSEATGAKVDARDPVAIYNIKADGTAALGKLLAKCAERPACKH